MKSLLLCLGLVLLHLLPSDLSSLYIVEYLFDPLSYLIATLVSFSNIPSTSSMMMKVGFYDML